MKNNKGFSLVELIIVITIMAVLIGVLAPAYLQYVEKAKKTTDCTAIGSVMDAIEVVSMDPTITWETGKKVEVSISTQATYDYDGTGTAVEEAIELIVSGSETSLNSSWASVTFEAVRDGDGNIVFTNYGGSVTLAELEEISPALAKRFE